MKLKGKVALVTGGGRGLGRAYVLHLASLGADVIINDIDLNAAAEYNEQLTAPTVMAEVEALGCRALGIQADVMNKDAVDAMFEEGLGTFGRIDILVNNAGGALKTPPNNSAAEADIDHYKYTMDLNLTSAILCCQAASRPMKEQRSTALRQGGFSPRARWRVVATVKRPGRACCRKSPYAAWAYPKIAPKWSSFSSPTCPIMSQANAFLSAVGWWPGGNRCFQARWKVGLNSPRHIMWYTDNSIV